MKIVNTQRIIMMLSFVIALNATDKFMYCGSEKVGDYGSKVFIRLSEKCVIGTPCTDKNLICKETLIYNMKFGSETPESDDFRDAIPVTGSMCMPELENAFEAEDVGRCKQLKNGFKYIQRLILENEKDALEKANINQVINLQKEQDSVIV